MWQSIGEKVSWLAYQWLAQGKLSPPWFYICHVCLSVYLSLSGCHSLNWGDASVSVSVSEITFRVMSSICLSVIWVTVIKSYVWPSASSIWFMSTHFYSCKRRTVRSSWRLEDMGFLVKLNLKEPFLPFWGEARCKIRAITIIGGHEVPLLQICVATWVHLYKNVISRDLKCEFLFQCFSVLFCFCVTIRLDSHTHHHTFPIFL